MKLKNRKSGFTLLKIIIVIIIVGVLASLALPRFFKTIAFSRSTEALNAIGVAKRAADRCALMAGAGAGVDYSQCTTFGQIGIDDPGAVPGANFTYAVAYAGGSPETLTFTADEGGATTDVITVVYDTAAGTITRSGTGNYSGLQ